MDGLARMWDIREAALKRYVYVIGRRSEYKLPNLSSKYELCSQRKTDDNLTSDDDKEESATNLENDLMSGNTTLPVQIALPPIPHRSESGTINNNVASNNSNNNNDVQNIVVPPLPPGVNPLGQENERTSAQAVIEANHQERCDEGVRLLSKLQHGEAANSLFQGPGTRARRKAVKVICLARCPIGGHFATGSDDGIGRIWEDFEDRRLIELDALKNEYKNSRTQQKNKYTYKDSSINYRDIGEWRKCLPQLI